MNMKQHEIVKQLTDQHLKQAVYQSRALFLLISILLSFLFFRNVTFLVVYLSFQMNEIIIYGIVPGLLLSSFAISLYYFLPKQLFDDGGINEKLFRNQSITSFSFISLIVSICEEILFRGVIQTAF